MTLNTFSAGVNTSFSSELNQNFSGVIVASITSPTVLEFSSTSSTSTTT